jgi:hypothetical protein
MSPPQPQTQKPKKETLMISTIEGNNFVGSLLEPLLKKVTHVVGLRML